MDLRRVVGIVVVIGLAAGVPGAALAREVDDGMSCSAEVDATGELLDMLDEVTGFPGETPKLSLPPVLKKSVKIGKATVGASVTATGSIDKVDEECGTSTVTITASLGVSVSIKAKLKVFGGGVTAGTGASTKYELVMNTAQLDAAQAAGAPLPNPFDIDSVPPGASITITEETFRSLGMEAAYRGLTVSGTVTHSAGDVVQVTRGTGDQANIVTVMVGPKEAVKNERSVGIGSDLVTGMLGLPGVNAKASLGRADTLTEGSVSYYAFDLSTPEGRDAYAVVMAGGTPPPSTGRGSAVYVTLDSVSSISAELGQFKLSEVFGSDTARLEVRQYPDGRYETTLRGTRGNTDVVMTWPSDASGNMLGEPAVTMTFNDLSAGQAVELNVATGGDMNQRFDGRQDVTITLTGSEWMVWRDRMAAYNGQQHPGDAWTGARERAGGAATLVDFILALTSIHTDMIAGVIRGQIWDLGGGKQELPGAVDVRPAGTCP